MNDHRDITSSGRITQTEIDRLIRRAHRLRSEETSRVLRNVGKRMRAAFHR